MNSIIEKNRVWIDDTWDKLDKKLKNIAVKSRNKLPYTTVNGVHDNRCEDDIYWWTNGFWGGMMWIMYKVTGNEEYRITAENSEELLDEALKDYKQLHHDVGFMWHLTSGANYRITGNKESCNKNLFVASTLFSRYNINGEYIRAWNGDHCYNWTIIDCMMNIPMLYWASKEIGDDRFKLVAMKHADMVLRDHIREDGSVNHIVEHDYNTGKMIRVHAGQGYSETSCWSRGLAWAVYGTVLSYIHTGKEEYLEAAKKTADFFISNCEQFDYLTPVDFGMPKEEKYYDSTAGVCTACGLLEIAKCVSKSEAEKYMDAAIKVLKATDEHFCNYDGDEDSLVQMGTLRYPHESMDEVHIPIIYGDFFFVEAMSKLKGENFLIW